jgi:MFS family permease
MQADLGISVTASQWILNVTLMILAGIVTVGGALGDRAGRLRVFRVGLIVLIAGAAVTVGAGLVNSFPLVLLGRGVEGLGVALFLPASTALLLDVFPLAERGGAQGKMMMISMFVTAFAPTAVGLVIQFVTWPLTYLFTIFSAVIALWLQRKVKYEQVAVPHNRFDYFGSVLIFLTVSLLITGIMQAGTAGWTSPLVLLLIGAGLVVGAVLVITSLRKQYPLIQFRLLQIRNVALGVFISLMRFLPNVLMGAFVARYVQQVMGLSPTVAGLLMIVPVLAQVVVAPIGGRMLDRGGPRTPVALGVGLLGAGLLLLAFGFPAQNLWLVVLGTILGGAGFSFTNPVQMAALSETPVNQRGMLAGVFPLAGNFGTALFVALLTAGLTTLMNSYFAANPAATEAAAQASALGQLAWVGLAVTLFTFAAALMLRNPQPAPSQPPATATAQPIAGK